MNLQDHTVSPATLTYISPVISPDTIATKAYVSLNNSKGHWRPGLFVNVEIITDLIDSPLVVNKEAIQRVDGCDCTFVETDKGFVKREIKTGRNDSQMIEILSGMTPGEKYVSKNSFILKAEMKKDSAKDDD
jgi:cobalt-zinc-cadmium efflux system membrane fusion protein